MNNQNLLKRYPELEEMFQELKELIQEATYPPDRIFLDDEDLIERLKVCKRTLAKWRSQRVIQFSRCDGKIFYTLSDVLDFMKKHVVPTIDSQLKIKL